MKMIDRCCQLSARARALLVLSVLPSALSFVPVQQRQKWQYSIDYNPLSRSLQSVPLDHIAETAVSGNPRDVVSTLVVAHDTASEGFLAANPAIGSSLIMLTIVGLLYLWEESVDWVREEIPKPLLPVVESILAEVGGLGFIGLVLEVVLGNSAVKEGLEGVSLILFGESDVLVENFEFLHAAFFQVGVGFFIAVGAMTAVGIRKLNEIKTVEGLQVDTDTGACTVTSDKLVQYIPLEKINENEDVSGTNSLWRELFMGKEERAGRTLLMRYQIMRYFPNLPVSFRMEPMIQASFAQNLYHLVEVSPLTWIYLIPALSLANAIDLSHEVINSASPNAAESVGFFFSTPSAIIPSIISVLVSAVWGWWNCWKTTQVKYMVMPRLGCNPNTLETTILPPLVESDSERQAFDSSPAWVRPIESIWGTPATTHMEELFGTAGGAGLKLYQNSIKYQTWLALTQIVFFGTQVVPRDIAALVSGATVGDPSHLTAELATYGIFVLISLSQLLLVSPRAFWNYCLVAAIEKETARQLMIMSGTDLEAETTVMEGTANGTVATEVGV